MSRKVMVASALLSLSLIPLANAEEPAATEKQLQVAYCIPGLQAEISMRRRMVEALQKAPDKSQELVSERTKAKQLLGTMEHVLDQMIAFVQSLLPYPEGSPAQQAEARGMKDYDDYQAMTLRCSQKCYNAGASIDKCEDACRDKELLGRLQVCSQVTRSFQ